MKLLTFLSNFRKKAAIVAIICLFYCGSAFSNNLSITGVSLTGQNLVGLYTKVQFSIAWDNSWRVTAAPANWDACWVFVKYRKKNSTVWYHATMHYGDGTAAMDGHTQPANSTITGVSDGKGVFIYRSAAMAQGSVSYANVQLRWDYGSDNLLSTDYVEVAVFGIEMVYVPQGSFVVGSGGSETGHFYTYPTTTTTYTIASENAITVSAASGNLYYASGSNSTGDATGIISAGYPKGYAAFYCMKYQISQDQYVSFLNKLTYTQQAARTAVAPSSAAGTGAMANPNANRNGIDIKTPGVSATTPAVYACNLDADAIYDETTDGGGIACNLLEWEDIIAYLDWAALRPMTELEHEKACRGTAAAVANEYAWGTTTNTSATGITNSGLDTEVPSVSTAVSVAGGAASVQGPMRVGCMADATSTRATSGATYYGIMDMSGNLWNYIVTVGHATGRAYSGLNGNGALSTSGDADVSGWPLTVTGTGFRGGNWSFAVANMRVSDRAFAANAQAGRYHSFGGRGVREP